MCVTACIPSALGTFSGVKCNSNGTFAGSVLGLPWDFENWRQMGRWACFCEGAAEKLCAGNVCTLEAHGGGNAVATTKS